MPSIAGVNHLQAVHAFEKAGFQIICQSKHIMMSDGTHVLSIPCNNPINAYTLGTIVRGSGLTVEEFRRLL